MVDAFAYGQRLMVEQRIEGRDVAVSVVDLGWGCGLPSVEIMTEDGCYDYDARYATDESEYFCSGAFLFPRPLADMQVMAVEAHTTLGLRDLSRMDFR